MTIGHFGLVMASRPSFRPAQLKIEYPVTGSYYTKGVSVALARGSAQTLRWH
jgi:hypothetical protein